MKFDKEGTVHKPMAELVIAFDLMGLCIGVEALEDTVCGFLIGVFHQASIGFLEELPSGVEDMKSDDDRGDGIEDTDVCKPHKANPKNTRNARPHIGEDVQSVGAEDRRLVFFSDGEKMQAKGEIECDQAASEQKPHPKAL